MNLTTLDRIKLRLGHDVKEDSLEDDLYLNLISGVSAQCIKYIRREIELKIREFYFDVGPFTKFVMVNSYPIKTVVSINNDPGREFLEATELEFNRDFVLDRGGTTGIIKFLNHLITGIEVLKVQVEGGLAETADRATIGLDIDGEQSFDLNALFRAEVSRTLVRVVKTKDAYDRIGVSIIAGSGLSVGEKIVEIKAPYPSQATITEILNPLPLVLTNPDIVNACETQVTHEWEKRKSPGKVSVTMPTGSVAYAGSVELLQLVKNTLDKYKNRAAQYA